MRPEWLFPLGFLLILAGFVMLVAGSLSSGSASAGVVVFIGPLPLIFGSGPQGSQLALISLVASVVMILLGYLWLRGRMTLRRERDSGSSDDRS